MSAKNVTVMAVKSALAALAFSAAAQTAADSTQKPLDQAIESVDRNLAKDPDNPGLNRAAQRLRGNQERIELQRADRLERPVRPERPALPERPQRPMR